MNDFEIAAKINLEKGDVSPLEVGFKLNRLPMASIGTREGRGYATPREALLRLMM